MGRELWMEGKPPSFPRHTAPNNFLQVTGGSGYAQEGGEKPAHCHGVRDTCSTQLCPLISVCVGIKISVFFLCKKEKKILLA